MSSSHDDVIELVTILKAVITKDDYAILRSFLHETTGPKNDTVEARFATNLLYLCTVYPHIIYACAQYFPEKYCLDESNHPNQALIEIFVNSGDSSYVNTETYKTIVREKTYENPASISYTTQAGFSRKLRELNPHGSETFDRLLSTFAGGSIEAVAIHLTRILYDYPNLLCHFSTFLPAPLRLLAYSCLQWPQKIVTIPMKVNENKNRLTNAKVVIDFIIAEKASSSEFCPITFKEIEDKL